MKLACAFLIAILPASAAAQRVTVDYALAVDSADLSGYAVEMRIHHAPDTLRLAMAAHPEYDERFRRQVRDLRAEGRSGAAAVVREDSAVWRIVAPGGEVTVRYRIELPPPADGARPSWVPFLAPTGGLVGGPHSFMYLLGDEDAASTVALRLPAGWDAATGMEPAAAANAWRATKFAEVMDGPILVGRLRRWRFAVDGVPHDVVYWPLPGAAPFDTTALVDALRKIVEQSRSVFGALPYRRFAFLLRDGAYGGLEHATSTTLGAPSAELAGDRSDFLLSAAHEYFHTWNLVRLRPAGWGGLSHRPPARTRELWWSEGVTMYFADLVLRRAGLLPDAPSRLEALREQLSRYLDDPGFARISPERASWTADDPPGADGDYRGDHYLQGQLLAAALELVVRDSTGGRRGMDDVMRTMYARHAGPAGFAGADVERTASSVCGCSLHRFFGRHVRAAELLDFDAYLRPLGLRARMALEPVRGPAGEPLPDLRVWSYLPPGEPHLALIITDARGTWARAGLHTGDRVVALDGVPIGDTRAFRTTVRALRVGSRVRVDVLRAGHPVRADVEIGSYSRRAVTLTDLPAVSPRQRQMRQRWLDATP
ncbi:PDZ domain-containing protein [Longimicrobium sp.]|uniref:M61 family metallopeptidase n=1 Tax=Longimicrobium sp. TaxID=2029185 RepID=UPI002B7F979F|nr:PDZ domain-containing protein [Longimicrobium sp.]HSU13896.1 PDZ domain-containing protein [Longimicrobium sp.]